LNVQATEVRLLPPPNCFAVKHTNNHMANTVNSQFAVKHRINIWVVIYNLKV